MMNHGALVCIYLAHFIDTQLERNALMADVYPKIKEYCRENHGLEFQVLVTLMVISQ